MKKINLEKIIGKVESHLEDVLNYPVSVRFFEEEEDDDETIPESISVFVDTHEVDDNVSSCISDIIDGVSDIYPDLECNNSECNEMIVVKFILPN